MKFKVTKSDLLDGLHVVQNVVSVRSTLPILSNVLISGEDGRLWLTTTDMEVSVRCGIQADIVEEGTTTMPVRRLSSIVRELPDAAIEISVDDSDVATLDCGSSFFKIVGLSAEEFPVVSSPEDKFCYQLDQGTFSEMLQRTAYAASTDETRYVLNGVLLSFKEAKLTMVATDGRRLALIENEVDFPDEAASEMILPSKAVQELIHVLGDEGELRIYSKENQIIFEFGNVFVASKLIDGTYPNYKQVIPSQCEERITIEREALWTALRRVSLLTNEKSSATKLTFGDNKLVILTNTPDVGEARETVPVKYAGKEISIAFNPEYMMDPLRTLTSDEVYFELTDELSPGVMKSDVPFLYVLMPMRVS